MDLATLNQASGILTYRGLTLESKEGINLAPSLETFDIPIDGISEAADERVAQNMLKLTFTPTGEWPSAPGILMPYLTMTEGQFVLPVVPVSINTGTDVLTGANHPFVVGDRVLVGTKAGGTLPTIAATDVDPDTYYYVGTVTANTFMLYASRANALSETSPVNFDGAGADVRIVAQFDLVLNLVDGRQIEGAAVAITKQPDLDLQAEATPFGEIEFTFFTRSRKQPEDANSLYTESAVAFPGWSANSADIKTQSQLVAWANQLAVEDVDLDTESLTITAHGLFTGAKVYPGTTGTFPTSAPALDADTPLYARVVDVDTITLHSSAAGAAGNTGTVAFTAAGSGVLFLTIDNPPWTLQESEAGVQVTSNVALNDRKSDRAGMYNMQFAGCRLEVKLIPLTVSTKQALDALRLQGANAARGRSLAAAARPLSVWSPGMYLRVNGAALKSATIAQNMKDTEVRELTFVNTRSVVAGVKQSPGYVSTSLSATATTYTEA